MSELEMTLASLFKKKGKSEMPEKEFVFAASMDFRWFVPKEAQKLLDVALGAGLLKSKNGRVFPSFDYKSVKVPSGFKPSQEILKTAPAPKGRFLEIVDMISTERDMSRKEVIALVNSTQDRMNVEAEVAALIVARRLEIDISELIDEVESEIAARNG